MVQGGTAVNALFYAAEAGVVALAEGSGIDTRRQHQLKADAASEMHEMGVLGRDYGPILRTLSQARKDIWYEGDDPGFRTSPPRKPPRCRPFEMEPTGIEPVTSCLQSRRSPS